MRLHVQLRRPLLIDSYDALGIPHQDGDLQPGHEEHEIEAGEAEPRLRSLVGTHPVEDLWFCLRVLAVVGNPRWQEAVLKLATALRTPNAELDVEPAPVEAEDLDATAQAGTAASEEEVLGPQPLHGIDFTTLDRVLIRSVISALNNVEGALSWDELDDLVQEVVELSDGRTRSHFHRGFVDGLTEHGLATSSAPGGNRDRRAWYLCGYFHAVLRRKTDAAFVQELLDLPKSDREILLEPRDGAALLATIALRPLLSSGRLDSATRLFSVHGGREPVKLLRGVLAWSGEGLLGPEVPAQGTVLLEKAVDLCHELAKDPETAPPAALRRDLERRLASALRREGKHANAQALLDDLLEEPLSPEEAVELNARRGLVEVGVRTLDRFELPEEEAPRRALLQAIEKARPFFEEGAREPVPSPLALYALALPRVAELETPSPEGADQLRRALDHMQHSGRAVWRHSGLMDRSRLYLALLDLRDADDGTVASAVDRFHAVLQEGIPAPADVLLTGVADAVIRDAPAVHDVACLALERYGHRALAHLDLPALAARSESFRAALRQLLEEHAEELTTDERWTAWDGLLTGSLSAHRRDLETASEALDQLERLAEHNGCAERFRKLIEEAHRFEPVWEPSDRNEALIRLHLRANRLGEAGALLHSLAQSAISEGRFRDAEDLIDMMRTEVGAGEGLEALERRLAAERETVAPPSPSPTRQGDLEASILFVGGNEKQQAYFHRLAESFLNTHPGVALHFEASGWSSNWNRMVDRLDNRITTADAIIIMRFVRTNLGGTLRRRAGQLGIPWIPCTGHGYSSLERAIQEAIEVVDGQRSRGR